METKSRKGRSRLARLAVHVVIASGLLVAFSPSAADAYWGFEDCKYAAYQQCYVGNGYKAINIVQTSIWCADGQCPSNFNENVREGNHRGRKHQVGQRLQQQQRSLVDMAER